MATVRTASPLVKRLPFPTGLLLLLVACGSREMPIGPAPVPTPGPDEVFVGAGDIGSCEPNSAPNLTAALIDRIPGTVFTTGDNAYSSGSASDFKNCYEPWWGRFKERTRPSPGNHDYETAGASGYFAYFGASAGPTGLGYYSYNLGSWHIISLNSETSAFPGSPQMVWLHGDLMSNRSLCTLAYFHTPVFGSGSNGGSVQMQAIWRELYNFDVDIVVNGHNHSYERFAPQTPDGAGDPVRGIREFVVGTGGAPLNGFPTLQTNSEIRSSTWGVLKLTLGTARYNWEFVPVAGASFIDSGSATCH
jgi:hypothetical protein